MIGDSATWAVAIAFIVVGFLEGFANFGAWNWVIAGILALIVPWLLMGRKK